MNGWLTMRSKEPYTQAYPKHCFIARFGLIAKDRRKFYIAWEKNHFSFEVEDGYLVMNVILAKFSDQIIEENLKHGVFNNELTSSFIKTASLLSLHYEVAISAEHSENADFVDMDVVSFEVSEDGVTFAFPVEKFKKRGVISNTLQEGVQS